MDWLRDFPVRDGGRGARYAGRWCADGVTEQVTRALQALTCFYGSETMRDRENNKGWQGLEWRIGQADIWRLGSYACEA